MTTGKTVALTRWAFVGKVMSLLFNMLSRLVITFLPRSKHLVLEFYTNRMIQSVLAFFLASFTGHERRIYSGSSMFIPFIIAKYNLLCL